MMDQRFQLQVQAYLDGELPPGKARRIARRLEQDPDARALLTELDHTRRALVGNEPERALPESGEFFWAKIRREIEKDAPHEPARAPAWTWEWWRRWFAPVPVAVAAALALLAVVGGYYGTQFGRHPRGASGLVETELADSGALTYRDYAVGITVVWLSYPAERGFIEPDLSDTLQ